MGLCADLTHVNLGLGREVHFVPMQPYWIRLPETDFFLADSYTVIANLYIL